MPNIQEEEGEAGTAKNTARDELLETQNLDPTST